MWAVRACGARARERAESSGAERGEGTGQRDSIADGTALRCGRVGSRHFQKPAFELASLFYVSFVLLEFHVCIRVSVVVQLFYSFINYSDIVCARQMPRVRVLPPHALRNVLIENLLSPYGKVI